ncbi:hypothetical protein ATHSA_p10013 (plasmid) [Athalassotoga saccharophila]|uniref:PLD phosphodiesterase domain-containing protein n=2 Tax=Athalassotoga saccharophila TaxID=1441386 RepID=A0A6N4TDK4_9BACT|nr:hypothetical protein ATHSA_p10013 [Athalassotoga saccharophila]
MNLFESKKVRYLNIILNDEIFEGTFGDLLEGFEELRAVTFVSSPKKFFDISRRFRKIILILGIEDNDALKNFDVINPESVKDFFNDLDKNTIEMIKDQKIEVRYAALGNAVHSKIFLLSGKKKRVITGSANLTQNALSDNSQFEDIIVYDEEYNPRIVSLLEKRFEYIYGKTIDFIPERYKNSKVYEISFASLEDNIELVKELAEKNQLAGIPSEVLESVTIPGFEEKMINIDIEHRKAKNGKEIFDELTKKTKKGIIFLPKDQIEKKRSIFADLLGQKDKQEDARAGIVYNPLDGFLYRTDKTIYSKSIEDRQEIAFFLDKLSKFVEAYRIFTIGSEEEKFETQIRVFEAILYTFVSPFIWKLRKIYVDEKQSEALRADIPIFLLIAGKTQTGKTHILEFLKVTLGHKFYIFDKEVKPQNIKAYLESKEVFPLLIDEVSKQYFSSTSESSYRGEEFIKTMVNYLKDTHPCVIATTNNKFGAGSQVVRRIYYLEMKVSFDMKKREEMDDYHASIIGDLNGKFFQDFLYRMAVKLNEGYSVTHDFLKIGREIFKEYFDETGKRPPEWLNRSVLDDYTVKSRNIWKMLYDTKKDGFKVRGKEIYVDTRKVFGEDHYEKENAKNFLPSSIIKEDSVVLILDREGFFRFIEYKEKIIEKLKRVLK